MLSVLQNHYLLDILIKGEVIEFIRKLQLFHDLLSVNIPDYQIRYSRTNQVLIVLCIVHLGYFCGMSFEFSYHWSCINIPQTNNLIKFRSNCYKVLIFYSNRQNCRYWPNWIPSNLLKLLLQTAFLRRLKQAKAISFVIALLAQSAKSIFRIADFAIHITCETFRFCCVEIILVFTLCANILFWALKAIWNSLKARQTTPHLILSDSFKKSYLAFTHTTHCLLHSEQLIGTSLIASSFRQIKPFKASSALVRLQWACSAIIVAALAPPIKLFTEFIVFAESPFKILLI